MFLQSFITRIIKFNILLVLLSTHFLLLGHFTQHLRKPEKTAHQPAIPIKISLVTLPPKNIQNSVKQIQEKPAVKKIQSVQKIITPKVVKSQNNVVTEKIHQKPIQKNSPKVHQKPIQKNLQEKRPITQASRPVTMSKSTTVQSTRPLKKSQPLASKPVPTPMPIPSNSPEKPVQVSTKQIVQKVEPPKPRQLGETKNPSYQGNPLKPPYPSLSRKRGEEGTVHLRVTVNPDGTPSSVTVVKSSGYSRLDNAAVSHVQQWRFSPAKKEGTAVSGTVIVPISFRLN